MYQTFKTILCTSSKNIKKWLVNKTEIKIIFKIKKGYYLQHLTSETMLLGSTKSKMSPKWFIFSKTFNSEFLCIKVWFIYHNSKPLEIESMIQKKINIKKIRNIWKIFIGLLTSLATASKSTKCVSLDNQKYMTHSTLINYILMNTAKIALLYISS